MREGVHDCLTAVVEQCAHTHTTVCHKTHTPHTLPLLLLLPRPAAYRHLTHPHHLGSQTMTGHPMLLCQLGWGVTGGTLCVCGDATIGYCCDDSTRWFQICAALSWFEIRIFGAHHWIDCAQCPMGGSNPLSSPSVPSFHAST